MSKQCLTLMVAGLLVGICTCDISGQTQAPVGGIDARTNTTQLATQLSSTDSLVRQKSAEALAQLAAVDQKKLVEGYQLQENNREVRLAMDWALYRMGTEEALYRVVHELNSPREDQAVRYLSQLDSPDLLYPFLQKSNNPSRINAGLIKALSRIGDSHTLDIIKPYRESLQAGVASAAENATDEIEKRLGQEPAPTTRSRPRSVSKP
ncbi:MAG: HEAT repeat domain-containing protein [Pyrinomonadaceae bacterium]